MSTPYNIDHNVQVALHHMTMGEKKTKEKEPKGGQSSKMHK